MTERAPGGAARSGREEATRILSRLETGSSPEDRRALFELVYAELRRVAEDYMRRQPDGHTLQATALVHEAFVRLVDRDAGWNDRAHFFRAAAQAMRSILVDHARSKGRLKRGGQRERRPLDDVVASVEESTGSFLDLDEALVRLASVDDELARLVELRFFAGLTNEEAARTLAMSTPTVERRWRAARSWLRAELEGAR